MKTIIKFRHAAMLLALGSCVASCSEDDSTPAAQIITIDFETPGTILAGPTSYGANLYDGYKGTQYTEAEFPVSDGVKLHIGVNVSSWTGTIDFYGGGMALSQWNYMSNTPELSNPGWWCSYENQCSVYNTKSIDGANHGAGADGSNTFAVSFGYSGPNSSSNCSRMYFTNKTEYQLRSIEVCNTAYVYGTMANGNPFGNTPDKNLEEAEGWFMVEFYGYDAAGNPTNGGKPVEFYLADYRKDSPTRTKAIDKWTTCSLQELGNVNAIEVNFKGSDTGTFGLNTPSYVCLDNLRIVK